MSVYLGDNAECDVHCFIAQKKKNYNNRGKILHDSLHVSLLQHWHVTAMFSSDNMWSLQRVMAISFVYCCIQF